jgi:hypothetical protein
MAYPGCGGRSVALGRTTGKPAQLAVFLLSSCLLCQTDLQRVYDGLLMGSFPLPTVQDAVFLVTRKELHLAGYETQLEDLSRIRTLNIIRMDRIMSRIDKP